MAVLLEPGEVTVNLHRAESLKDADWFGKQDPYVILRCGENKYRSNTHERGGRDPAWEQQFVFKVDQETTLELEVYDQDMFKPDDCLGKGKVDIVSVRQIKKMSVEVPLFRRLSRRQAGHVYLTLSFSPARASASSGIRSAAAAATPAATPTAPNPGDAAMSTYVIHEQATAVANQFPTAFPGNGDGRGGDVETRDGAAVAAAGGVLAASSAHIPSGSSLAPGLVPAGSMPDTVPSYNPTCGLIQPHPDRLLPCHVSSSSTANSSTASLGVAATAPPHVTAPPTPGPYSSQQHAVHSQVYGMGPGFSVPPAGAAAVGHPAGAAGAPMHQPPPYQQPLAHYATAPGGIYHTSSHPYTPVMTAPPPQYGQPGITPPPPSPGSYHAPNPPQPAYSMPPPPSPSQASGYPPQLPFNPSLPSYHPVQHPPYGPPPVPPGYPSAHGYAHPGYP